MEVIPTKITIVIPAYNEAATIAMILDKVLETQLKWDLSKEVIIVNDGSQDRTEEVVKAYITAHPNADMRYFAHEKNKGKGAALQTGFKEATGDFVIIQDADLEYDPDEYNILLDPLIANKADVVYGSRFMGGKPHRVLYFWHMIGNRFLTLLSNMFSNLNLTDMETCYKVFRREIIQGIRLEQRGFGVEPEMTAKVAKIKGIRIYEVGISYFGRTYEEGKKIGAMDGLRAMWYIVKYNLFG